jgi:hypothetical protein
MKQIEVSGKDTNHESVAICYDTIAQGIREQKCFAHTRSWNLISWFAPFPALKHVVQQMDCLAVHTTYLKAIKDKVDLVQGREVLCDDLANRSGVWENLLHLGRILQLHSSKEIARSDNASGLHGILDLACLSSAELHNHLHGLALNIRLVGADLGAVLIEVTYNLKTRCFTVSVTTTCSSTVVVQSSCIKYELHQKISHPNRSAGAVLSAVWHCIR